MPAPFDFVDVVGTLKQVLGMMGCQVGDIVEMSVGDLRKAESFAAFGRVAKLLCRRSDANYDSCQAAHPAGTWDERGELVELKLRP
jgi:hypothetical protein